MVIERATESTVSRSAQTNPANVTERAVQEALQEILDACLSRINHISRDPPQISEATLSHPSHIESVISDKEVRRSHVEAVSPDKEAVRDSRLQSQYVAPDRIASAIFDELDEPMDSKQQVAFDDFISEVAANNASAELISNYQALDPTQASSEEVRVAELISGLNYEYPHVLISPSPQAPAEIFQTDDPNKGISCNLKLAQNQD